MGNQPEFIKILGQEQNTPEWYEILPKVALEGHALKCLRLTEKQNEQNVQNENRVFSKIHVLIYPDGGLTRLGLYTHDLPEQEGRKFLPLDQVKSIPFPEKIPSVVKPLHIPYQVNEKEIKLNFSRFKKGEEIDVASAALGGKVVKASNEHYGPAIQVISPYAPINMFDGLESARSRVKDHTEELIIGFSQARKIHRIEMDFTYFVNNNPLDVQAFGRCEVKGKSEIDWREIIPKTRVKTFAGNKKSFSLATPQVLTQIKVVIYPDGGMNRIHVYSFAE